MRVSQEEKDKSHARIVEAAARLLRERGIESTSVADVMGAAGMSHGGFYRHFPDKDGLVDAALHSAFEEFSSESGGALHQDSPEEAVAGYRAHYLSKGHARKQRPRLPGGGARRRGGAGTWRVEDGVWRGGQPDDLFAGPGHAGHGAGKARPGGARVCDDGRSHRHRAGERPANRPRGALRLPQEPGRCRWIVNALACRVTSITTTQSKVSL